MHRSKIQTQYPELSATLSADWLTGRLRVDALRRSLVLSLAAAWRENDGDVMDAFDKLADALDGDPSAAELSARVQAVENLSTDDAHAEIGLKTALRLRAELDAVIGTLSRFYSAEDVRLMAPPKQVSA